VAAASLGASAASTRSPWRTSAPRRHRRIRRLPALRQQDGDPGGHGRPVMDRLMAGPRRSSRPGWTRAEPDHAGAGHISVPQTHRDALASINARLRTLPDGRAAPAEPAAAAHIEEWVHLLAPLRRTWPTRGPLAVHAAIGAISRPVLPQRVGGERLSELLEEMATAAWAPRRRRLVNWLSLTDSGMKRPVAA